MQWLVRSGTSAANALVYIAIVLLFVVSIAKCAFPVMESRRVLRRAVRMIKSGEKSRHSWQEETFLGKGNLFMHWREYLNNLFFADGEFHNPSNVEDYINEDTAVYGPGRATLSEAVPGIMVSLGFLGTLIGISIGLKDFKMDGSDSILTAIPTLILGMRYAFNTSIVGVVASITFTLIVRFASDSSLRALNAFYSTMRQHAGVVSVDPMTQIAIYQQEQTALIQKLTNDVTGPMTDRIAQAVERSVKPMRQGMDDFMNAMTREQLRAIDAMVQRFMSQLDQAMDNQFQHLAITIDMSARNQQKMTADMQKTVENFSKLAHDTIQVQRMTDEMIDRFHEYLGKLNGSHKMVDDGYARIAANIEHLEIIARQQNAYLQTVSEMQSGVSQSLDGFRSATSAFMETFEKRIMDTTGSLNKMSDEMKRTNDSLTKAHRLFVDGVNTDIDKTYNQFFGRIQETTEQLNWLVEDIRNSIDRMPEMLSGAAAMYTDQSNRMTDALRDAQEALDNAANKISRSGR